MHSHSIRSPFPSCTFVYFHGRRATRKCTQNIKCFSSLQLLSAALCLIHNALPGLAPFPDSCCPDRHQITQAVRPLLTLGVTKLQQKNTYNFIYYLSVTTFLLCIKCSDLKNTLNFQKENDLKELKIYIHLKCKYRQQLANELQCDD